MAYYSYHIHRIQIITAREPNVRILVVEDDFTSSKLMERILEPYGEVDTVTNGKDAVEAVRAAFANGTPYTLICLDIMMPEMDGQEALKLIRKLEGEHEIPNGNEAHIIMTTALDDPQSVIEAYYRGGATSYVPKPIDKDHFLKLIKNLGLI